MINVLEQLRIYGMEKLGRYYSQYRAIVLDPKPDDLNTGNIKVHIPRVQGGITSIARSKSFIGGPGFGCKFFAPHAGEIVWVEFENGNPTSPVWSYHTWGKDECPKDLQDIHTCGIVTPNGNKFLIQETEDSNKVSILINGGTTIEIEDDKMTINGGKNKGLVNIESLREFIQAVSKDLLVAKSGTNVAQWMATDMATKLEDSNVTH